MYNKKLFSLVNIALLLSSISAKIMTKDEVLKIDTSKYKNIGFNNINECPDYSYDFWERDRCGFSFYCKDDNCASVSFANETTIEIPNKEGEIIKYITDTCSLAKIDSGDCESEKCTIDSQCLSNKCIKNHCAFNEDNPIVIARMLMNIIPSLLKVVPICSVVTLKEINARKTKTVLQNSAITVLV